MNNTTFGDWSSWSAPWVELQKTNQATAEKVIRECISYYSDNAATVAKASQTMPRITSPEDFFSTQMKFLAQQSERNLEFVQNIFQIYQDSLKEHCQWTEDKMSSAMKATHKTVKKHADDSTR